jgi:hypothetical protein
MSMMSGILFLCCFSFCFGFPFPFRCSSDEESPLFGSGNVGGRAGGRGRAGRGGEGRGRAGKGVPRSEGPRPFLFVPTLGSLSYGMNEL